MRAEQVGDSCLERKSENLENSEPSGYLAKLSCGGDGQARQPLDPESLAEM